MGTIVKLTISRSKSPVFCCSLTDSYTSVVILIPIFFADDAISLQNFESSAFVLYVTSLSEIFFPFSSLIPSPSVSLIPASSRSAFAPSMSYSYPSAPPKSIKSG